MKREVTCLRLGKESRGQSTCAAPSPVRALHLLLPPQSPLSDSMVNPSGMFWQSFRAQGRPGLPSSAVHAPKQSLKGNPQ